jgi:hypothetical protein
LIFTAVPEHTLATAQAIGCPDLSLSISILLSTSFGGRVLEGLRTSGLARDDRLRSIKKFTRWALSFDSCPQRYFAIPARCLSRISIRNGRVYVLPSSTHQRPVCEVIKMPSIGRRELIILDQASPMPPKVTSIGDVEEIRDNAVVVRTCDRTAKLRLKRQNSAARFKLLAERKAVEILATLKFRGSVKRSKGRRVTLKLSDLSISSQHSKHWQSVASIADQDSSVCFRIANEPFREVEAADLSRTVRKARMHASARCDRTVASRTSPLDRLEAAVTYEMIEQLIDHCQCLSAVLRPADSSGSNDCKSVDKRIVGLLIGEMKELIKLLRKEWPRVQEPNR